MAFWGKSGGLYTASLLLHAGVAAAVVRIEKPELHEATSVTVREVKREKPKPAEAPPPPPPPVQAPRPVRKIAKAAALPPVAPAAEPAPAAEAASSAPVADFGLAMTGGVGSGGIAVPLGNGTRAAPGAVTRKAPPKALTPGKPKPDGEAACIEALIKPKPIATPQPAYADRAREAGVQGKVRVELTVDESGAVVSARVLESLGYGLDEAALEAAKSWRFEPATRCGKTTATTFVVGIRFTL